jgi:hypothetical protein
VIFAKHLNRQARRRFPGAIEFSQSSVACCHVYSPLAAACPRHLLKSPRPFLRLLRPAHRSKSQRRNEVSV